jgi:hypothetical protein
MEQRQLRLGDILDDYCPRERRISNHAVVAMVGPDVKQTRCTTCDAEHAYKGGKVPPQRKKKNARASLYDQVLTDVTRTDGSVPDTPVAASPAPVAPSDMPGEVTAIASAEAQDVPQTVADAPAVPRVEEEGRVHRPLIRATLPRVDGQPAARPVPEFTVRQTTARQGKFHGRHGAGGPQVDRQKGRGQAGHGAASRGPGARPGPRRAGRPGHSPHVPGMRPVQHPQQSRHLRSGAPVHPGKKHSR